MADQMSFEQYFDADTEQWDRLLRDLDEDFRTRQLVEKALRDASSAFLSQLTQEDANYYMTTCGLFSDFFDLKIVMNYEQQKQVSETLKVAYLVHRHCVNNPKLSRESHEAHQLASVSLGLLVQKALDVSISFDDLKCNVETLNARVADSLASALADLDLEKYIDIPDDPFIIPESVIQATHPDFLETATPPVADNPMTLSPAPPMEAIGAAGTSRNRPASPSMAKEKALIMFSGRSSRPPPTRTQSMPTLSTQNRTPFKSHARGGNALGSLAEAMEMEEE